MQTQHVAVVLGSLLGRREGRVGLGDAYEAPRGAGVVGVHVGMVRLAEGVEGIFYLGGGGARLDLEGFVVVCCAVDGVMIVGCRFVVMEAGRGGLKGSLGLRGPR